MPKGKSSGNALKRIEHAIRLFIHGWNPSGNAKARNTTAKAWPALLQLAALRGEAILRLRFFDHFIPGLPIQYDAEQALALWNQLVEARGVIEDFVNRVGLAAALKQEAALPEHAAREARKLYCILCEALDREAPDLLKVGVDQLLEHNGNSSLARGHRHRNHASHPLPSCAISSHWPCASITKRRSRYANPSCKPKARCRSKFCSERPRTSRGRSWCR